MDPDPDRYGLAERAFKASIRAFAAASLSATDWSICGVGGKDAGPAGREDDAAGVEAAETAGDAV